MIVSIRFALLGFLAAACCTSAHASGIPPSPLCDEPGAPMVYPWTDPTAYARPKAVVPPEYPASQLAAGVTAQVEAALRINERGELKEVLAMKADNGDEAFEKAVREVVRYWSFERFSNCECKPVEFTARLTVWFEIKDGKPSISVSRRADEKAPPGLHAKPLKLVRDQAVFRKIAATIPPGLRRYGKIAIVYSMLTLTPETGAAESARIVHVDVDPEFRRFFGPAIEEALKQLRYEPFARAQEGPARACFEVVYHVD